MGVDHGCGLLFLNLSIIQTKIKRSILLLSLINFSRNDYFKFIDFISYSRKCLSRHEYVLVFSELQVAIIT